MDKNLNAVIYVAKTTIHNLIKKACTVQSGLEDLELLASNEYPIKEHINLLNADISSDLLDDMDNMYHLHLIPNAHTLMIAEYEHTGQEIPYVTVFKQGDGSIWREPNYAAMESPSVPKFRTFFYIKQLLEEKLENSTAAVNVKLRDFIHSPNPEKYIEFIKSELSVKQGKQGKFFAVVIIALTQIGVLKNSRGKFKGLHNALRREFPEKVGSYQAVNDYLTPHYKKGTASLKNVNQQELDDMVNKLKNI